MSDATTDGAHTHGPPHAPAQTPICRHPPTGLHARLHARYALAPSVCTPHTLARSRARSAARLPPRSLGRPRTPACFPPSPPSSPPQPPRGGRLFMVQEQG